jgi:hypothetical protein
MPSKPSHISDRCRVNNYVTLGKQVVLFSRCVYIVRLEVNTLLSVINIYQALRRHIQDSGFQNPNILTKNHAWVIHGKYKANRQFGIGLCH